MDALSQVNLIRSDLPAVSPLTAAARKWSRAWTWGGTVKYDRCEALPIYVDDATHLALLGLLRECADVSYAALAYVLAKWPDGYPAGATGATGFGRTCPPGIGRGFMNHLTLESRRLGVLGGSTRWNARERAGAHALSLCRTKVLSGILPSYSFSGDLPAGLSIRIACGRGYSGRPIHVSPDGAGLFLAEVGWAFPWRAEGAWTDGLGGRDPRSAQYIEVAHFDQMWWARLIYAAQGETRAPREKKARAPKVARSAGAASEPRRVVATMRGSETGDVLVLSYPPPTEAEEKARAEFRGGVLSWPEYAKEQNLFETDWSHVPERIRPRDKRA